MCEQVHTDTVNDSAHLPLKHHFLSFACAEKVTRGNAQRPVVNYWCYLCHLCSTLRTFLGKKYGSNIFVKIIVSLFKVTIQI